MRQFKLPAWVGAFQVQVTNGFFYLSIINTLLLVLTFWRTWGSEIALKYAPWLNFWMFAGSGIVLMLTVMILDYKFMYPSRQAFVNQQSCIHDNPAMDAINEIKKEVKRIADKVDA